jgi:hypothetical protein
VIYKYGGHSVLAITEQVTQNNLPAIKDESNTCEMQINVHLDQDLNMMGTAEAELQGAANPYLQLQRKSAKADFLFKGFKPDTCWISSSDLEKTEAKAELNEKLDFQEQDNYLFYTIPSPPNGIATLHIPTLSVTRINPIELPYQTFSEEYELQMEIPKNWTSAMPAVNISKKNSCGEITIKIEAKGNKIELLRSMTLTKQHISVTDYPQFLELWRLWQEPNSKTIVINKAK